MVVYDHNSIIGCMLSILYYLLSFVVKNMVAGGPLPLSFDATREQLYNVLAENPLTT